MHKFDLLGGMHPMLLFVLLLFALIVGVVMALSRSLAHAPEDERDAWKS